MNREETKRLLPILQAFAEGKTIQFLLAAEEWRDINEPSFDPCVTYRIKPVIVKFWVCHSITDGNPLATSSYYKDVEHWKQFPHIYDVREYTYDKE